MKNTFGGHFRLLTFWRILEIVQEKKLCGILSLQWDAESLQKMVDQNNLPADVTCGRGYVISNGKTLISAGFGEFSESDPKKLSIEECKKSIEALGVMIRVALGYGLDFIPDGYSNFTIDQQVQNHPNLLSNAGLRSHEILSIICDAAYFTYVDNLPRNHTEFIHWIYTEMNREMVKKPNKQI